MSDGLRRGADEGRLRPAGPLTQQWHFYLWEESCERTWKGTCSQTPKALLSSPALILDNVHKKRPIRGTAVQNSHRDLLWVGKGVLQVLLSKVTLVLDIAVAFLKQPLSSVLPLRPTASWRQSTPRPDNSHTYTHMKPCKKCNHILSPLSTDPHFTLRLRTIMGKKEKTIIEWWKGINVVLSAGSEGAMSI